MNKSLFGFFFISIALLLGALYFTDTIQKPFISSLNTLKSTYINITDEISKNIQEHFFQAEHIAALEEKLQNYERDKLLLVATQSHLNDLLKLNKSKLSIDPKLELVRTISYKEFGNTNRIWLDVKDYNSSKIYGLIYKGNVAGIVIEKNNQPLGLLNKDIKSSYAVYVGDKKAPGIAHGNNSKNLIVKFIPAWFSIQKGDEVVTSGLDKTFFKGLKVGKVLSVTKSGGYQNAVVEPYYKANEPNYFYMIKKVE